MTHEKMLCYTSASPFADPNLAKNIERWAGLLFCNQKRVPRGDRARIGCRERKGTVSIATVEMKPLTGTGPQYKGQQQLTMGPAFIESDKEVRQ